MDEDFGLKLFMAISGVTDEDTAYVGYLAARPIIDPVVERLEALYDETDTGEEDVQESPAQAIADNNEGYIEGHESFNLTIQSIEFEFGEQIPDDFVSGAEFALETIKQVADREVEIAKLAVQGANDFATTDNPRSFDDIFDVDSTR